MAKSTKLTIPSDPVERLQYIKRMFPNAVGRSLGDAWRGGRVEATRRLNDIDLAAYKRDQDNASKEASKLSPFLRHGCLSLKEAADTLIKKYGVASEPIVHALARRDYFRRVWYREGDRIFNNLEAPEVALDDKPMPDYIRQMITGVPCMDAIVKDLMHDGYVHNHARKWFAAYVIHWLKVDWREAADWFESYLLDGDKASNHLSWQWVASTFSDQPYFFNKDVLSRYTANKHCSKCTVNCPFDASLPVLESKLFPEFTLEAMPDRLVSSESVSAYSSNSAKAIFVHDEMLSAAHPLLQTSLPKLFIFDTKLHGKWPLKRLQFVASCLNELPNVEVWVGDIHAVLEARGIGQMITQNTPNLELKSLLSSYQVDWQPEVKFTRADISDENMKRFSNYWEKVGPSFYGDQLTIKSK